MSFPTLGFTSSTKVLQSFPSCTVTVYLAGTVTLATLYSDNSGTALANPFTANTEGHFQFWADDGIYDIRLSSGGIPSPFTRYSNSNLDPYYLAPFSNSTKRLINSKLSDVLSVKDFGCVGNGIADDTTCIQNAINSAYTLGKSVYLPGGTYGTSAPLVMYTNSSLICENYGLPTSIATDAKTTVIKSLASWAKSTGDALVTNDQTTMAFYSSIKGCVFEGNRTTGPDYGIYYLNGNSLTLTDVLVNVTRLDGIFLDTDGVRTAQSGTFQNVVIYSAVQNSGLAARHGALHLEWTDVVLNAVGPTTSSEASYSEGGKRIACYFGPASASGAMTNSDCAHSEVGLRIESFGWRISNSRTDFDAGDGWQLISGSNIFSNVQSLYDSRASANTYDGFNVTSSANLFTGVTITAAASAGQQRYGMYFVNTNDPPNMVFGVELVDAGGASFTGEMATTDSTHLIWDGNYRRAPVTFLNNFATGAVNVFRTSLIVLSNGTAGAYTVTSLTNGFPGQRVTFLYAGNADPPSILTTANIFLNKPWKPLGAAGGIGTAPQASLTLITPDGTNWYEESRQDYGVGIGVSSAIVNDYSETANNRHWDMLANTGFQQLLLRVCNDTVTTCNNWGVVGRSGATPTQVTFPVRVATGPGAGDDGTSSLQVYGGALRSIGRTFAQLGSPNAGSMVWCSDCVVASTCAGSGSGAWAFRVAGPSWKCPF